jgi:pimeloyl-ACP methyl ester carboxylesterase
MKWLLPVCGLTCFLSARPAAEPANVLVNEAGFATMPPVTFYYHYGSYGSRLELTSSEARIWYTFHAADGDAARKPLLVFFNGGPGGATSAGLQSMYTSRYTLNREIESGGGDRFIPNPVPWTRLGNLLYVDARQCGFSYGLLDKVSDTQARFEEFNAQNFGPFVDSAEFVRLLLRFLAQHPDLRDNPVVIVGESYGGARATVMLHLLLNYADYGNGVEMFQDPTLAAEIQTHLETVFPEYRGHRVPPEIVARQFGHQVLIQPTLSMGYQTSVANDLWRQRGSVLYQIGREVGIPYNPLVYDDPLDYVYYVARRDLYIYTKPREWLNGFFANAGRLLRFTQNLSLVTGTDVTKVAGLYAAQRSSAYRLADPSTVSDNEARALGTTVDVALFLAPGRLDPPTGVEPGDLQQVFGALRPWDRYFIRSNPNASWAFHFYNVARLSGYEVNYRHPRFGRMFLKNLIFVRTFVTNAALDLVVYSEAIAPALARHTEIVTGVRHERTQPAVDRPGQLVVSYRPDAYADVAPAGSRTIRFPLYAKSCHAVSLTQPEDLFADVSRWFSENGLVRQ